MAPALDPRLAAGRPWSAGAGGWTSASWPPPCLACSGLYPKVIGSDLRPGPLAKARQTVEAAHCQDRVELRLGDGLSVLSAGEVGTVVIAGVSAQTAWQMLEAAPWVFAPEGPRLVLIPATRHDELRRWLAEHGFRLVCDRPVEAAGRWYAVMAAEYDGQRRTLTWAQALYGRTGGRGPRLRGQTAGKTAKAAPGHPGREPRRP